MIPIERVRVWERLMVAAGKLLEEEGSLTALVEAQALTHAADLDLKRMIAEEGLAAGGGDSGDRIRDAG